MCSENSVGIECFTTETPGFLAILKQRYSDFIVNEVDLSGTVLRLTDLSSIPKAPDEPTDTFLLPRISRGGWQQIARGQRVGSSRECPPHRMAQVRGGSRVIAGGEGDECDDGWGIHTAVGTSLAT
eukprot:jgi/Mesvir1/23230/Mv09235-RA.1